MTTPKINTISRGGSRFYVDPSTGDTVPGVTSILNMLPKPFLQGWAAKVVAEFAVDNMSEFSGLVMKGERQAAVDVLKGAPRRFTAGAASIGSEAHDVFEKRAKGEDPGRLHPEIAVFDRHFCEFLDEMQPEFLFLEETVFNQTVEYAGSFDAMMSIQGERVVADWKTTRSGVHAEVALQLAAYRHAEYILRPDGSKVPIPALEGGAVLHVRPEGWSLVPVACGVEQFEIFTHLRKVFDWDTGMNKNVIGQQIAGTAAVKKRAPMPKKAKA
jgi:hypothetical protein